MDHDILVTGATGNVGAHVVPELLATGATVRALSRDPAAARLPAGAQVIAGDLMRPSSLEGALAGTSAVFLVWPLTGTEHAPALIEAIARHTPRIVYLSAHGDVPFHAAMERLIERAGVEWTFLRPGGFATNARMWAPQIRDGDVVRWPFAAAARALIHERDIAAVAARALTDPGYSAARLHLSGPEILTQAEQVHAIGEAIGRALRYEEISRAAALEQLVEAWGDAAFADHALDTWERFVTAPEPVTATVAEVTGTPPRRFRDWARDHAADFI